jgi:hypothetical protein
MGALFLPHHSFRQAIIQTSLPGPARVHCTYLQLDGRGKADLPKHKQRACSGPVAGGAVRLDDAVDLSVDGGDPGNQRTHRTHHGPRHLREFVSAISKLATPPDRHTVVHRQHHQHWRRPQFHGRCSAGSVRRRSRSRRRHGSSRSRDCGPVGRGSGSNDKSAIDLPATPEVQSDTAIAMLAACGCGNPCGGRAKH